MTNEFMDGFMNAEDLQGTENPFLQDQKELTDKEVQADEKTFMKDGLLHCGVCSEPLEAYFPDDFALVFYRGKTHGRQCACQRAASEASAAHMRRIQHECNVERLRSNCFDNKKAASKTFENSEYWGDAYYKCLAYVQNWEQMKKDNIGFMLSGEPGTGKSYLAMAIANALMDKEVSVIMRNPADFTSSEFERKDMLLQEVAAPSLYILDDFGMERDTPYAMEIMFQVIDRRYQCGKHLIITTNLSQAAMKEATDITHRRIYDRVMEMCPNLTVRGENLRMKLCEEKMDFMRGILNKTAENK